MSPFEPPETLRVGDRDVTCHIVRRNRRTILLRFRGEAEIIEALVPVGMPREALRAFLADHADWIAARLATRRERKAIASRFEGDGPVYFLGEPLRLRLREGLPRRAVREGGELVVTLSPPHPNPGAVRRIVYGWFAERAAEMLPGRVAECRRLAASENLPPVGRLVFRPMRSRWGSCSSQGRIALDTMLLQAPAECVDYVIRHELCHLVHMDHSPRFHALLERLDPDWRRHRAFLRTVDSMP